MNSRYSPPLLPCEVRRRFFQKHVLKLKLADTALQFPDPLAVGHIGRQLLPGEFPPVRLYPEPECGIVDIQFAAPPRLSSEAARSRPLS